MNIHEFQAKQLFAQFGVPVPNGKEIKTPLAAEKWAEKLNAPVYVVKAQIHAGGRGKAGFWGTIGRVLSRPLTDDRLRGGGVIRRAAALAPLGHRPAPRSGVIARARFSYWAAPAGRASPGGRAPRTSPPY